MSLYSTRKSGRGSSGYGQNKQGAILPLFADTGEDSAIPPRTLEETLYLLNPHIDASLVQDTLVVQMFGYSEKTLRARWGLSPTADLRRAMQLRNRFLYNYFCLAEEGLRLHLEAVIGNGKYMTLETVTQQAAIVAHVYNGHARNIAKYLDGLAQNAAFNIDHGTFIEHDIEDEDDESDEDDIGF